jgi:3',5'-cyclic-nucleotide phosphodiesterase
VARRTNNSDFRRRQYLRVEPRAGSDSVYNAGKTTGEEDGGNHRKAGHAAPIMLDRRRPMKLQILGCAGGIGGRERLTTSLLVDRDILLDAGTGLTDLDLDRLCAIDHVFLTHAHLDHVAGLALLLDAVQGRRAAPVTVYASEPVVQALKTHLFNWVLWPDFGAIPDTQRPTLRWEIMATGSTVTIGGRSISSHPVDHTPGACAYAVRTQEDGFLFTGDMGSTPSLWTMLAGDPALRTVIVDCSFVNADSRIAELSKHFCPRALLAEIAALERPVEFLIYHLKPGHEDLIMDELGAGGPGSGFRALRCGDLLLFGDEAR